MTRQRIVVRLPPAGRVYGSAKDTICCTFHMVTFEIIDETGDMMSKIMEIVIINKHSNC